MSLPAKFEVLRATQVKALEEINDAFRRVPVVVVDAPTGSGKTVLGEAARISQGVRGVYLCSSKGLQDQFLSDFPESKLVKGRANYSTYDNAELYPEVTAADCTRSEGACDWCHPVACCPYEVAKRQAQSADVAVLNTAYWLHEVQGMFSAFRGAEFTVIDECDLLEKEVMGFVEARLPRRLVKRLGLGKPKYVTKPESWVAWLDQVVLPKLRRYRQRLPREELVHRQEARRVTEAIGRLARVRAGLDTDTWTLDSKNEQVVFRPVVVNTMGEELIWRHSQRFLMMSGTVISAESLLTRLGYQGSWELVSVPSTFCTSNRLVRIRPSASFSHTSIERGEGLSDASRVITRYVRGGVAVHAAANGEGHDKRVLVHCVSYQLAQDAGNYFASQGLDVHAYASATDRESVVGRWLDSRAGVLCAPSLDRGIDLDDDKCRCQIVLKVPYPNLGDKQVSARLHSEGGQEWYLEETVRTLVQMCGRIVRSETDYGTTYILDKEFLGLWRRAEHLFPKWWKEAVRWN